MHIEYNKPIIRQIHSIEHLGVRRLRQINTVEAGNLYGVGENAEGVSLYSGVAYVQQVVVLQIDEFGVLVAVFEFASVDGVVALNHEDLGGEVDDKGLFIVVVDLHRLEEVGVDFVDID